MPKNIDTTTLFSKSQELLSDDYEVRDVSICPNALASEINQMSRGESSMSFWGGRGNKKNRNRRPGKSGPQTGDTGADRNIGGQHGRNNHREDRSEHNRVPKRPVGPRGNGN